MCIARAYLRGQEDEPVLQDVAHIRLYDDRVEMKTLFGVEKVISGKVVEIDFMSSKVFLDSDKQA